jgi:hypothetical protein
VPASSPAERPPDDVRVKWQNRTEETYVVTVLGSGDTVPAWEEAAPCAGGEMQVDTDEPFIIGIASWDADFSEPGRTVADHEAYREAGGRLLLIIEAGPIPDEPMVSLDTWSEQRSSLPGGCP